MAHVGAFDDQTTLRKSRRHAGKRQLVNIFIGSNAGSTWIHAIKFFPPAGIFRLHGRESALDWEAVLESVVVAVVKTIQQRCLFFRALDGLTS